MMQGFGSGLVRAAIALLMAVGLSVAGWAHRTPLADDGAAAGLAVYLAAGGSVADLCGAPDGTARADADCPSCRMPGTVPLPVHIALPMTVVVTTVVVGVIGDGPHGSDGHPPWYGRAPPVV